MRKRYLVVSLVLILWAVSVSPVMAVPKMDGGYYVWPYWQFQPAWADAPYAGIAAKKFSVHGCLVTSMAMLLKYYGFEKIPTEFHYPDFYKETNPGTLNNWLTEHNGFSYNKKRGV